MKNQTLPARSWWALLLVGLVLMFPGMAALTEQAPPSGEKPPAKAPLNTLPAQLHNVTITPIAAGPQAGQLLLEGELRGAVKPVVPTPARVGGQLKIVEGKLSKVLNLGREPFAEGQKQYARDLGKARSLVFLHDRGQTRRAVKDPKVQLTDQQEQRGMLLPLQGLPALPAAEEELLRKHSLMITDLKVVEDERARGTGPWTFGHLMTQLANEPATGIPAADFTRHWLAHWEKEQIINSLPVPNREKGIRSLIIDPWQKDSGDGKPLDLARAPFRLLAIVSRLDLRNNLVLGAERIGFGGAGEARFVFCAVDRNKGDAPLPFTVIFEFAIKKGSFQGVRQWAQQWYHLKDLPLGSPEYNKALQAITDQFVTAGSDPESPPNRSALGQLRSNEIALVLNIPGVKPVWEIREFRIDVNNSGFLRQVTAKQTPDLSFNKPADKDKQAVLANLVNSMEEDLLHGRHSVPVDFPAGKPILGPAAPTPPNNFWQAPGIKNPDARHFLSLGTCSGCHAREAFLNVTAPDDLSQDQPPPHFTHVRPRQQGKEARLSFFLTGKDANGQDYRLADPAGQKDANEPGGIKKRPFNDLGNRAHDLAALVKYGAYYESHRLPVQRTH